ncbi:MAG: tyrosine-type recombinase/integrase, partial [Planctomycetota bacterium]
MALTLQQALRKYVTECRRVKPTTLRRNERCFTEFIAVVGNKPLTEAGKADLMAYQSAVLARGLDRTSANSYCRAVNSVLGWLVDVDEMYANPKIKPLKCNRKPVTVWEGDEFPRLLDAIDRIDWRDPTMRLRLRALLLTTCCDGWGLRLGEALNLRWLDIDLDKAILTVQHRPRKPGQWEWGTKGYRDRTVPMGEALKETLTKMQDMCKWLYPYLPRRRYRALIQIQEIPYETRCCPWRPYKALEHVRRVAKIKTGGAFHKGRRTTGTTFAGAVHLLQLRDLMGHADSKTTELYYVAQREKTTVVA